MTTDIENILRTSKAAAAKWQTQDSVAGLHLLAESIGKDATADWDQGAGEEWGRIVVGDDTVAYVAMARPLVGVRADLEKRAMPLQQRGFQTLVLADLDEPLLRCQRRVLEDWAGRPISDHHCRGT